MLSIYLRYMINEAAMSGLPNVRGFVVVSSRTKHNIGQLCNRIYDEAWALRAPGITFTTVGFTTLQLIWDKLVCVCLR